MLVGFSHDCLMSFCENVLVKSRAWARKKVSHSWGRVEIEDGCLQIVASA